MSLQLELQNRLGAHRIKELQNPLHPEQKLLVLYLEFQIPITVLMTSTLSEYTMPVSEKWRDRAFSELYFALPAYWDLEDIGNANFNWVFDWLYRLESFVREKNTWFGPGHTIPTANPPQQISELSKQEFFIFIDPIYLNEALGPIRTNGKTIYFLAAVPITGDELDYKIGKGTQKFVRKFIQRGYDERLDVYRKSIMSTRMRLF